MADPALGTSEPLARGAGSVLGTVSLGGADSLTQPEVSTADPLVCALFRASVPLEPSVAPQATCSGSAPASRAALECFQEQMLSFQAAMQRQMEAITLFVVSAQPLVVPAIPQDLPTLDSATPRDLPALRDPSGWPRSCGACVDPLNGA